MSQIKFKTLTEEERYICNHTISYTAIFWLIIDHLYNNQPMSIVRFGDGEYRIIRDSLKYSGKFQAFGDEWNERLGLLDIDIKILAKHLVDAGNSCKYLSPSTSGFFYSIYYGWDLFKKRDLYVDIWWYYKIPADQKNLILSNAKGIAYIYNDSDWLIQAARSKNLNQKIEGINMKSYKDISEVLNFIKNTDCQLIMWAGGPIGKILGPKIEEMGKIGLDVGSAIKNWA